MSATSPLPAAAAPGAARAPALRVRALAKDFAIGDARIDVLRGVDLELGHGERLAIVGASGAGKSTLLHIAGLLDRPSAGSVEIDGVSGWELEADPRAALRNQKIGFVFQFYHLVNELDAFENALLPAMIAHGFLEYRRRRAEYERRAHELLERFGLAHRLKHRPGQLSGGERQRVALARALLFDPPILIADEPTGNLDSATGAKVLELLFDEQRRRRNSLLLVTHDERVAARCERIVRMSDGRIVDGA